MANCYFKSQPVAFIAQDILCRANEPNLIMKENNSNSDPGDPLDLPLYGPWIQVKY